jgi:TetR/AcrR family transcriptional regulator, copper-responsive repressor
LNQLVLYNVNERMGRPKKFSRDGVIEKAIPIFWERGFACTSVQELELATGVNKSGLYAEFADKEALFLASLRYYLDHRGEREILLAEPLGWANVENILRLGVGRSEGRRGCFSVSSMREMAILPDETQEIIVKNRTQMRQLLAKNVRAANPSADPDSLAELIMVFFSGLCLEQNLKSGASSSTRKIKGFMQVLRTL